MKRILMLTALTALFSVAALADIRLPDKPKETPTPQTGDKSAEMIIEISSEVTEPTLVINQRVMGQTAAAESASTGAGATQTIVGGLFLSLAFVFGGVLLARGRGNLPKAAVGAVLIAVLSVAGTIVYANVAPPRTLPINKALFTKNLDGYAFARGNVKVKISAGDFEADVRLLIPQEKAATINKKGKKNDEDE